MTWEAEKDGTPGFSGQRTPKRHQFRAKCRKIEKLSKKKSEDDSPAVSTTGVNDLQGLGDPTPPKPVVKLFALFLLIARLKVR